MLRRPRANEGIIAVRSVLDGAERDGRPPREAAERLALAGLSRLEAEHS